MGGCVRILFTSSEAAICMALAGLDVGGPPVVAWRRASSYRCGRRLLKDWAELFFYGCMFTQALGFGGRRGRSVRFACVLCSQFHLDTMMAQEGCEG